MTKTQKRVSAVLDKINKMSLADEADAKMFSGALELMLDELLHNDGFGTEGQNDPRGDQRNKHTWSMYYVEGVDK